MTPDALSGRHEKRGLTSPWGVEIQDPGDGHQGQGGIQSVQVALRSTAAWSWGLIGNLERRACHDARKDWLRSQVCCQMHVRCRTSVPVPWCCATEPAATAHAHSASCLRHLSVPLEMWAGGA